MKKIILQFATLFFMAAVLLPAAAMAQKETYDLIKYSPPKGWVKEVKQNVVTYSITNNKNKTWCRLSIFKSTVSKGNIDRDFESEWQDLVVKTYHPSSKLVVVKANPELLAGAPGGATVSFAGLFLVVKGFTKPTDDKTASIFFM